MMFWGGGVGRVPVSKGRINQSYYMQGTILTLENGNRYLISNFKNQNQVEENWKMTTPTHKTEGRLESARWGR
jgi:hypothetical protein